MTIFRYFIALLLAFRVTAGEPLDLPKDIDASAYSAEDKMEISAARKFSKEKAVCEANYRTRIATVVANADRAEVFLLDFQPIPKPEDPAEDQWFVIAPYNLYRKIITTTKLDEKKTALVKASIQELLRQRDDLGGGAWCHYPIHGVRLFKGDRLLFQSSFCWQCQNYFMRYPDSDTDTDTAKWVGVERGSSIERLLKTLMPIPQSEVDRFEAATKTKPQAGDVGAKNRDQK